MPTQIERKLENGENGKFVLWKFHHEKNKYTNKQTNQRAVLTQKKSNLQNEATYQKIKGDVI